MEIFFLQTIAPQLMAISSVLISFKRSYKKRSSCVRTRSFCTRTNSTIIHFTNNTFLPIFTEKKKKIAAKREKETHKHYEWYQTFFVYIIWILKLKRSFDWWFVKVSNAADTNSLFYYHKFCNCAFKMLSHSFQTKSNKNLHHLCIPFRISFNHSN